MMDTRCELKEYIDSYTRPIVEKKLVVTSDRNNNFVHLTIEGTGMSIRVRVDELLAAVKACSSHPFI
jgi:hypothetical protein